MSISQPFSGLQKRLFSVPKLEDANMAGTKEAWREPALPWHMTCRVLRVLQLEEKPMYFFGCLDRFPSRKTAVLVLPCTWEELRRSLFKGWSNVARRRATTAPWSWPKETRRRCRKGSCAWMHPHEEWTKLSCFHLSLQLDWGIWANSWLGYDW